MAHTRTTMCISVLLVAKISSMRECRQRLRQKKRFGDQRLVVVDPSHIQLQPNLSYEGQVQIINRKY